MLSQIFSFQEMKRDFHFGVSRLPHTEHPLSLALNITLPFLFNLLSHFRSLLSRHVPDTPVYLMLITLSVLRCMLSPCSMSLLSSLYLRHPLIFLAVIENSEGTMRVKRGRSCSSGCSAAIRHLRARQGYGGTSTHMHTKHTHSGLTSPMTTSKVFLHRRGRIKEWKGQGLGD